MGGVAMFVAVMGGVITLIAILFTCVCTKVEWCPGYYANEARIQRKRVNTMRALMEHRREVGIVDNRLSSTLLRNEAYSGSSTEFNPFSVGKLGKQRKLFQEGLQDGDVPMHLYRVYLSGYNLIYDPWVVDENPPEAAAHLLDAEKYRAMALKVNALAPHLGQTKVVSFLLHLLCYPLGSLYLRRQQRIRAYVLREYFHAYDHDCVISARSRALMNTFKFRTDPECTVAYIDIIGPKPVDRESHLPLILFLTGDGSYWSPYQVDVSDILVRSVPHLVELETFIDQAWLQMLGKLNAALRIVHPSQWMMSCQPSLHVIERSIPQLGGLGVRLGRFSTPECKTLRPGIVLHRERKSRLSFDSVSPLLAENISVSSDMAGMRQPSPGLFLDQLVSKDQLKASAAALEAFQLEEQHRELNPLHSDGAKSKIFPSSASLESSRVRQASLSEKIPDALYYSDDDMGRLFPGQFARVLGPLDSDEEDTAIVDEESDQEVSMELRYIPYWICAHLGVLSNQRPRSRDSKIQYRVALSTLIVADILCTFFLATSFYCVNIETGHGCIHTLVILFTSIYPLALIAGPILGFTFVVFPLSGMGRQYAMWNALSILNALTACVISVVLKKNFSPETSFLSFGLVACKILQARAVDWYIAMIETDQGGRRK